MEAPISEGFQVKLDPHSSRPSRTPAIKNDISKKGMPLARHRLNYTQKAPASKSFLVEFPEHWEPPERCSMNFLISPEGELQMNSQSMDEAGRSSRENLWTNVTLGVLCRRAES
jgi:hypothetical protein